MTSDFGWGGLASTAFTVDPVRPLLRQLVHQALLD
jgi:hypothetical protein